MDVQEFAPWYQAWACGISLIVLNAIIHVGGLAAVHARLAPVFARHSVRRRLTGKGAVLIAVTVTAVTVLHGIEGVVWAASYILIGAIADPRIAMLYSIEAMTSYGHVNIDLPKHWQMLGALEALNGMILFGLTTAFLFGLLQSTALFQRR